MKKLTLLLAIGLFIFTSCKKDDLELKENKNTANTETINNVKFKFHDTISIFDNTGKYFVEYLVESNNEKEVKNQINNFKNARLILLVKKPISGNKSIKNNLYCSKNNFDFTNTLSITEQKRNIGTSKGYTFENINKTQFSYTVSSTQNITLNFPANQVSQVDITNTWIYNCNVAKYDYRNDGTLNLYEVRTLTPNSPYSWGIGTFGSKFYIFPSYVNSSWPINNRIYYTIYI